MIVKQELYCHECQRYVQFDIDEELNGEHVIICPNCGHEHCRVVDNGRITEARWDSRNKAFVYNPNTAIYVSGATSSVVSTWVSYSGGTTSAQVYTDAASAFTYASWMSLTANS